MSVVRKILIVEDDDAIRQLIRKTLEQEDWQVLEAISVKRAIIGAQAHQPACVILDLGLTDGDGMDFIAAYRSWSNAPIIVLTARHQELSKVQALDAGANDYMTKPFGIAELLARIRAQMRQHRPSMQQDVYVFGQNTIHFENRQVLRKEEEVHLTPIEYNLLLELIRNEGKVATQRQLLVAVWGPNFVEEPQYLRIYMRKLRQKLEHDPTNPEHFLTEVGVGYRFIGAL